MDIKIKESIGFLKSCVDTKRTNDALQILETIEQYFDGNLLNSEIDLALNCIFNESTGVIGFLRKTITLNKAFKDVNAKLLILLIKLIVKFKGKIKQYVKNTIDTCLKYILSTMVTAKEKEKSIQIIQEIVTNKLIDLNTDVIDLLNGLFRIFNLKNSPARFLQYTYELLGMMARDYPECMLQGYDVRVRNMYFETLEKSLLQEEDVSFLAVNGALKGFNHFLVTCSPNKSNEPDICQRIYGCVKKLSDPGGDIRDRSAFRSALNLLSNHGELFSEQLFKDNQYWHSALLKWLVLPWEDRRCAIYALQTLHCEIARTLHRRNRPTEDVTILKFFINYFKSTLEQPHSKSYEIRIAIRGFGVMAEACKLLLPAEYLNNLLMLVIQRTEYAISGQNSTAQQHTTRKENLEHFPDFVRALSQIMKHVNELTGIQMHSLETIIVLLIRDFHFLSSAHHSLVITSIFMTFENLSRLGESTLTDLLEKITLQGIIWTCSHKLLIEANLDWELRDIDWKENTTYKQYLPLWIGLLTVQQQHQQHPQHHPQLSEYKLINNSNFIITEKLYDNLMRNLFTILEKLNLATTKRIYKDLNTGENQDLYFSDPNLDLEPLNRKDFHIFFNLIDFYTDLFRSPICLPVHVEHLPKWLNLLCETLILKSISHPLISGFLKLLKSIIILCDKLKIFHDQRSSSSINNNYESIDIEMELDQFNQSVNNLETSQLKQNLVVFLKNILNKCESETGTTGELQIACLQLIFSMPIELSDNFLICDFIQVFLIAFDIGKSMLSMAHKALTLLEKLTVRNTNTSININRNGNGGDGGDGANLFMEFLKSVLPSLDVYLQSMDVNQQSNQQQHSIALPNLIKKSKSYSIQKIWADKLEGGGGGGGSGDGNDSELLKLQKRIIFYLGTLEPKNCLYLIGAVGAANESHENNTNNNNNENLIKWDIEQNIRLNLNYPKMRSTIYLDSLIPRICELAMTATDRKTKIAAAELLHSIILYLIGINNHKGNIWKELSMRMLYLSVDNDIAVREMFEPLTMQIVHYLSQRSQLFGEGVEHLLDCLMECIANGGGGGGGDGAQSTSSSSSRSTSNTMNTAVRDLAARALREFLSWTIRQTTPAQLAASPMDFNVILSKLKLYCFHSNYYKRVGAAIAFNNLYRVFREEDTLINVYAFELLYMFCINFRMSEELNAELLHHHHHHHHHRRDTGNSTATTTTNPSSNVYLEQQSLCLDHIVRMIRQRTIILNETNHPNRIKPKPFAGITLKDCVLWVLTECGSKKQYYREKCIWIFMELSPLVRSSYDQTAGNYGSAGQFFKQTQTIDTILELCEGLPLQMEVAAAAAAATNPKQFKSIQQRIEKNLNFIKDIVEHPDSCVTHRISAIQLIFIWLEKLLATIDLYIWLLSSNGFIADIPNLLKRSILFEVIEYYLKNVYSKSIGEILHSIDVKLLTSGTADDVVNGKSHQMITDLLFMERISNIKCLIICRIVDFFIKILPIHKEYFPIKFWKSLRMMMMMTIDDMEDVGVVVPDDDDDDDIILNLVIIIIFHPHDLGFQLKHYAFIERLSRNIEQLLDVLIRHTPSGFSTKLNIKLTEELLQRYDRIVNTTEELLNSDTISTGQMNSAKGVLFVCKQIKRKKIILTRTGTESNEQINPGKHSILNDFGMNMIKNLFNGLRKIIFNEYYPVRLSPKVKQYANLLLSICFEIDDDDAELFQCCIDQMLNVDCAVLRMENSATIKHGKYFMNIYKMTIFEYLFRTYEKSIGMLVNKMTTENVMDIIQIIIQFTEYLYKSKQFDKVSLHAILTILLNNWPKMFAIAKDSDCITMDFQLIEYMSHLAMICPFKLNRIGDQTGFQTFLLNIINDRQNPIELKSRAIFLLPCIIGDEGDGGDAGDSVDGDNLENSTKKHKELKETLYNLNSQYFPLKTIEFLEGSLERSAFCNTFNMLLDALVISGSPILLEFIINITISDDQHILESAIQSALERFMKAKCDVNGQVECLRCPFRLFENVELEPGIRLTVMRRYLLPMIRFSYLDSILAFYTQHIKRIVEQTETNYALANAGWMVEQALVHRIGAYQLIEILFGTVRKELIQDGPIAPVIIGTDKSANFFGILTKKAYGSRSDIFVTDDRMATELFRQYQCAAYNALCAIVCNTQTELKFYTTLLFKELPTQNKLIWQKLIDIKNDTWMDFPQTFDKYPKIKERLVSIRSVGISSTMESASSSSSSSSSSLADSTKKLLSTKHNIRYIQSQNVFESSLSQDVTKLDLNFSNVRTSSELAAAKFENSQATVSIPLEQFSINQHEVMATLCAVIKHMYVQKITPISGDPQKIRKNVPQWVEMLCGIIGNSRQPRNVRLFLAKCIENCRDIFRNYAAAVNQSILQLLADECAGSTLNCFNIDLIVMLIEWGGGGGQQSNDQQLQYYKLQTNEEFQLAGDVLKFIMKNCWFDRKEIFRRNLEICKLLIEMWKDQIVISKQFLFDSINKSQQLNSKENLCGIQLNAIVLANNLIPWTTNDTRNVYFHLLYKCLDNEFTIIYQPAAQLLGMCLQRVMPDDEEGNGNIDNLATEELDTLYTELIDKLQHLVREKDSKKFTDIIYGIQKYYSKIIDPFLLVISNFIPNSSGPIKRIYLEMFLARCDTYKLNVYREILAIGIQDLLKIKEFKCIALHILNKVMSKLNVSEIHFIFIQFNLKQFLMDENQMCRDIVYEILMYIHEHIDDDDDGDGNRMEGSNNQKAPAIVELLKQSTTTLLLNGLSDADVQIQNRLFKFWSNECNLSMNPDERLLKLFGKCYDSNSARTFLSFCTQLILEPAIQDPQSKRQIFEHEYDEADSKFYEYDINLSYRKQNSILMAPLFTQTQQLLAGDFSNKQYLRATITDVVFEPTHDPLSILQTTNNFTLQTHNSLLFSVATETLDRRSNRINQCGMGTKRFASTTNTIQKNPKQNVVTNDDDSFNKLRRRFLIDRELTGKAIAYKTIEKHKYELMTGGDQRKEKDRHVQLYRRYRTGDYPDLLINNLAILLPLQGLVKRDQLLARKVLVSIVTAIINNNNDVDDDDDELPTPTAAPSANGFITELSGHIENILKKNSKTCDAFIFTTLMEIALIKPQQFVIAPEVISMCATTNQMLSIAILYLENRLCAISNRDMEPDDHPSSINDVESQHWMELTNLYFALSEYDVVCGIFADKLKTDPMLACAIEYEMNGDWLRAQKYYLDIIKKTQQSSAETIEVDFAYQSYFNCLAEMGNWTLLSKYTRDQIGQDTNELWTDQWNQEKLLPHYLKSNVRLILEGKRDQAIGDFLKVITEWMTTPNKEKSNWIQRYHGEELMMLEITNGNYLQARVHSEQYLMRLLAEWGNLSILSQKIRAEKLLNICKVSEIHQFTSVLITPSESSPSSPSNNLAVINEFIIRLTNSKPQVTDSLLLWNSIITYRCFICSILIDRLRKKTIDLSSNQQQSQYTDTNTENYFNAKKLSIEKLLNLTFSMNFNLLNIALEQKNIQLSDKLIYGLSNYEKNYESENENDLKKSLQWLIARSKHQQLKAQSKKSVTATTTTTTTDAIQLLLQSWQRIDLNVLNNVMIYKYPDIHIQAVNQAASICIEFIEDHGLRSMVMVSGAAADDNQRDDDVVRQTYRKQLFERTSTSKNSNIDGRLYEHAMYCLKKSVKIAEANNRNIINNKPAAAAYDSEEQSSITTTTTTTSTSSSSTNVPNLALANAYFNLAQFCYDSCEKSHIQNTIELEKLLIVSVLRGMRYNSKECHQMFAVLLQLKNLLNNNLTELFTDESFHVPEWMFLRWIPQILSRLNFYQECYLDALINRLVTAYPIAIIYQFQLAYDQSKSKLNQPSSSFLRSISFDRPFIVNVRDRLNLPIYNSFITALNCVCIPEKIIEYHLTNIYNSCGGGGDGDGEGKQQQQQKLVRERNTLDKIQLVLNQLFDVNQKNYQGKSFERIQSFKLILEDLKGLVNDPTKLMKTIQSHLAALKKKPSLASRTTFEKDSKITLDSLSPWFANHHFEWHNNNNNCRLIDEDLEIPGQYDGGQRPNVNLHIKIIKFEQSIKIYESKRSPIKLTIHGSNAQLYNFIIKYGEDLRQDQRIQQLLTLMNEQLNMDKNCRQNNLSINTFDVIPVNWYCGMIKCIDNAALTINDILVNVWQRHGGGGGGGGGGGNSRDFTKKVTEISIDHMEFLKKGAAAAATAISDHHSTSTSGSQTSTIVMDLKNIYGRAACHYSREQIMTKFQELSYGFPEDLIRATFIDISLSPESFFTLRNQFAMSLATMNIAHWLLGIGDRHLSNMLLNTKNGSVIGIDFSLTFGAATRDLNIPEMVPFRLTPQFVNVMQPLGTTGFLSKCMIHTLRALRANSKVLTACMDVFVHEPTIDWLETARSKLADDQVSLASSASSNWEPNVRIKFAKLKLMGINPKIGLIEDLSASLVLRSCPEYIEAYKRILNGHPQHNKRAQLNADNLTVEQQVSCLIDLATDPVILGLSYIGFRPWL